MFVEALEEHARIEVEASALRQRKIGAYNSGSCVRQLWYIEQDYPSIPRESRSMLIFDHGYWIERGLLGLLERAVAGLRWSTKEDKLALEPIGNVRGDAFLWDPELKLEVPVDIKSMSEYAFRRFAEGEVNWGHVCQMECYMRVYNAPYSYLVGYRKQETARVGPEFPLHDVRVERSDLVWAHILQSVETARGEACPERPHALEWQCKGCDGTGLTKVRKQKHAACEGTGQIPGGPLIPGFPCSWCSYRDSCWGELEPIEIGNATRLRPVNAAPSEAPEESKTA